MGRHTYVSQIIWLLIYVKLFFIQQNILFIFDKTTDDNEYKLILL